MRNVEPVEQPKRKKKSGLRSPTPNATWRELIDTGLFFRKDPETFDDAGCDRDALLALARRLVACEELARIPSSWRHLFGVQPRDLSSASEVLEDAALIVERLNESVLLSLPRMVSRAARKAGRELTDIEKAANSYLTDLPNSLRFLVKSVRDLMGPALQSTPEKRFKRERDAALSDLLLNAAGKPGTTTFATAVPQFEVVARLLNATRDVLDHELVEHGVQATTPKKRPHTGDSLRKFWNRLTIRKALGLPSKKQQSS